MLAGRLPTRIRCWGWERRYLPIDIHPWTMRNRVPGNRLTDGYLMDDNSCSVQAVENGLFGGGDVSSVVVGTELYLIPMM